MPNRFVWRKMRCREQNWKRWGPYLSERQWGTVREDYSASGNCWEYFPHDHARSRAYRWGEDGLLGITDRECRLCFSLALWNGRDPILKERLFGLTNGEGNHGEDVKECYYYLDATPTASYLKAALQISAGCIPVCLAGGRKSPPRQVSSRNSNWPMPAYSMRTATSMSSSSTRRIAERYFHSHHCLQSRTGTGHAAFAADLMVSQHLVLGLQARRLLAQAAAASIGRRARYRRSHNAQAIPLVGGADAAR